MKTNGSYTRAFGDEGSSLESTELDGLQVIFDQKVGLHPANLQKAVRPARPVRRTRYRDPSLGMRHALR